MKFKFLAVAGALCAGLAAVTPASAQAVYCPAGYAYSPGYGCVPVASGYGAVYAAPPVRVYQPPVYDPLAIAFGFGPGYGHHIDHHPHGHDDHGHHH